MRSPQASIARLLVVVAVVAVNLAMGRALSHFDPESLSLSGAAPGVLAISIAFLLLIRSRAPARSRAFWAGFLACSLLAELVYVQTMLSPPTFHQNKAVSWPQMTMTDPGSPLWHAWDFYLSKIYPLLRPYHGDLLDRRASSAILRAAVAYLPQGLLGLTGGLVVGFFGRRGELTHTHRGKQWTSSQIPS